MRCSARSPYYYSFTLHRYIYQLKRAPMNYTKSSSLQNKVVLLLFTPTYPDAQQLVSVLFCSKMKGGCLS